MRICHESQVPIVPRGAGTGLSGGALPNSTRVLLVLTKLNHILEIDPHNFCPWVEPGVHNLALSEATQPFGLYYAPDPSSQVACTIGDNVA
jgi:glycolate oxidase